MRSVKTSRGTSIPWLDRETSVKPGFARNYLRRAVWHTAAANLRQLEEDRSSQARPSATTGSPPRVVLDTSLTFHAERSRLFGSITSSDIADRFGSRASTSS
jgi:ribosomal protein L9